MYGSLGLSKALEGEASSRAVAAGQGPDGRRDHDKQLLDFKARVTDTATSKNYLDPKHFAQLYSDLGTVMVVAGLLIGGTYQGLYAAYSPPDAPAPLNVNRTGNVSLSTAFAQFNVTENVTAIEERSSEPPGYDVQVAYLCGLAPLQLMFNCSGSCRSLGSARSTSWRLGSR
jgi:hypothetical protein